MAQLHQSPTHPGAYVRERIIPSGMSITEAAKRIGISRPALSNFLNGKSALSARMAARLAKAFGARRERLLEMQAAWDRQKQRGREQQVAVRAFVPAFLSIKARQIDDWAATEIDARTLLPVLLRKLVHSTSDDLRRVDFPGYDNGQRRGPDGLVDAGSATPWVPAGRSCWELSTTKQPTAKANRDFAARSNSVEPAERAISAFVFVTPRNWPGKAAWERQKSEGGGWRSVRAFDASDLEQWLEQSVPAQIWLAEQLQRQLPVRGCETLKQAWSRWADGSEPRLTPEIFAPAVAASRTRFKNWLSRPCDRPFVVAADSRFEALAFLACLFKDPELDASKKDLAAVFTSPPLLRTLVASSVPFIPIVHDSDTERELGGACRRLHCIVFRHRNSVEPPADIELGLLRDDSFRQALSSMGLDESRIDRLARESGHSPTILRRRLSKNSAIRMPEWASDDAKARSLVAMSLLGAWHSAVKADQGIVSSVADRAYEKVELSVRDLLGVDDTPVWSAGRYRGVASKIDALFAVARAVTETDLDRFFSAAGIVLSEFDPALDLPEEDRWTATLYGKEREHSDALREGVCETLVLLSVHGNYLFQSQLGIDVEGRVAALIRKLLTPLTIEKLLSHNQELPHYGEAAPEAFLDMLEEDRKRKNPVVFGLLKPTRGEAPLESPPRMGLLQALECLAWNPRTLARVGRILAWLSRLEINDNWINKPEKSLRAIFRPWMPQTAASLEQRVSTLKLLASEFPDVAWDLCINAIRPGRSFGSPTYKPRWRNDASGAGQVLARKEVHETLRQALDSLIGWPSYNEKTLGDLVECLEALPEKHELKLWQRVEEWARGSGESAKAELREQVRRFVFTPHGRGRNLAKATRARARAACKCLRADDPVIRHGWLFANEWVQPSAEGMEIEAFDYSKHEELIDEQRRQAIDEIWSARGFAGIRDLLSRGGAAPVVGTYAHRAALSRAGAGTRTDFIRRCLAIEGDLRDQAEQCLQAFLRVSSEDFEPAVLRATADELDGSDLKRFLTCAPFQACTWSLLDNYSKEVRAAYWKNVVPSPGLRPPAELIELIDCLLDARRPRAAFNAAKLQFRDVETSRLKRLLLAVATVDAEPDGHYLLHRYHLSKALDSLGDREGVTPDLMAQLEFLFIGAFDHNELRLSNLQARIADSPELFVRMVAFAYGRRDGGEDPPEWGIKDPKKKQALGSAARQLLDGIRKIPGEDENGKIQPQPLTRWISGVRKLCEKHGRVAIGDQRVGQLLARAPAGENGHWPCQAVCQAMEETASPHIGNGFLVGIHNSRGVQLRGEGGLQERKLAARYRAMAERLHFEYPNVGKVLEDIARSYDQEAQWWETEAKKDRRLHQ